MKLSAIEWLKRLVDDKTQTDRTPLLELVKLPKPVRRPSANKPEAEAMDKEVVQLVAQKLNRPQII